MQQLILFNERRMSTTAAEIAPIQTNELTPGHVKMSSRSRASRKSQEPRWHSFIGTGFFVVVIGFNLILAAMVMFGGNKKHASPEDIAKSVHAARIKQPMFDGTFCHYTLYDSESAKMLDDRVAPCKEGPLHK